jgi:hypothetical protein
MRRGFVVSHSILFSIAVGQSSVPPRLDVTSLGRFAAGHGITVNTATQDLLTSGVEFDGKRFQFRMYDVHAQPLRLGYCGLESAESTSAEVGALRWTGLECRFQDGNGALKVRESLLTPVLWFELSHSDLTLFADVVTAKTEGLTLPLQKVTRREGDQLYDGRLDGPMKEPWILATVRTGGYRFPMVILFHQNPVTIGRRPGGGIEIAFQKGTNAQVGLLPLWGCRPATDKLTAGWSKGAQSSAIAAARDAVHSFLAIPTHVQESYAIRDGKLAVTNQVTFEPARDDWGWSRPFAIVPPAVAGAWKQGLPMTLPASVRTLAMPGFTGPTAFVPGRASFTYTVAIPDVWSTIFSPVYNSQVAKLLSPSVNHALTEYSKSVETLFSKPYASVFGTSAIGEGRVLTAEYMNYRMMSDAARAKFDRYADQAAADTIFNRAKCYAYGREVGNGRQFLIDNYRISGHDYIDAGWFGYNITAMWARAHYAGHWADVRKNWSWIRELFYGWNWSFSDWAVMYAPLYVDATNGGNPKGYTDNMAMLPALYAWARMAKKMGDDATYRDALYMIVRDRIGRANRALVYRHLKECGFETEAPVLVSDQGNGPGLSLTSKYVPTVPQSWLSDPVVHFGAASTGLWFQTGSYFEPPSMETVSLLREAKLWPSVVAQYAEIDRRYPRWFASPDVSETSHYQLFARGMGGDPESLSYWARYQEGLASGGWNNEAWHAYGYAGIWASNLLERANEGDLESFVMSDRDGVRWLGVWNISASPVTARNVRFTPGFTLLSLGSVQTGIKALSLPPSVPCVVGEWTSFTAAVRNTSKSSQLFKLRSVSSAFRSFESITLKPGQAGKLRGEIKLDRLTAQASNVSIRLVGGGEKAIANGVVRAFSLPRCTATLELVGEPLTRLPDLARVHLVAKNWQARPISVRVEAVLNRGKIYGHDISLAGGQRIDETIPLTLADKLLGQQRLQVSVVGPGITASERETVVIAPALGQAETLTLLGFENGLDGWYRPDWADGNRDAEGKLYGLSVIEGTLAMPLCIRDGKASQAFVGVRSNQRWTDVARVRTRIFLPADAPEGLTAQFFRVGEDWKWRDHTPLTILKPGQWTDLEIAINGSEGAAAWHIPESELAAGLNKMLDFGLKISHSASAKGWKGSVRIAPIEGDFR